MMKSNSQSRKEQTSEPVRKPYLTGSITDENTLKASLGFFGIMLITVFVAFIVCAAATFDSFILRLLMNTAVILVLLMIFYNKRKLWRGVKSCISAGKKGLNSVRVKRRSAIIR